MQFLTFEYKSPIDLHDGFVHRFTFSTGVTFKSLKAVTCCWQQKHDPRPATPEFQPGNVTVVCGVDGDGYAGGGGN